MSRIAASIALALAAALGGCATQPGLPVAHAAPVEQREPVTILVSIDGFRADYLDRGLTPSLANLAAEGVTASMYPSFPSKTFPNHWAEVTGFVPDKNGIVANGFVDPSRVEEKFTMATTDPYYWNDKEPIWVTAEKAGIRSAAMFWPGSAVAWGGALIPGGYGRVDGGVRPQDWTAFDQNVSPTQRVNTVIDWMRRPSDIRPQFVLLYFDEVDTAGHATGPDSEGLNAALKNVDADIAKLLKGLQTLGQPANIIVTSDHGMAETRTSRTVELNKVLSPEDYILVETGPYATLDAAPGRKEALEAKLLTKHDHMQCWRKGEIPARFEYGSNPRIPDYLCLAEVGWQIFTDRRDGERIGGTHGYDNRAPEMAALFVATGPAFRKALRLDSFANVDVNPLLRAVLGLPQSGELDGKLAPVVGALRQTP